MSQFTARDYELAARVIRETKPFFDAASDRAVLVHVSAAFSKAFAADNPQFKPVKFADACFPDQRVEKGAKR